MTVPWDHEFDRAWKYGYRLRAEKPFPVSRHRLPSTIKGTAPVDATERAVNARMHKPWYSQLGMVAFSGNPPPEPTAGNANSPAPQVKGAGPSTS